jgi:hypothetical protein
MNHFTRLSAVAGTLVALGVAAPSALAAPTPPTPPDGSFSGQTDTATFTAQSAASCVDPAVSSLLSAFGDDQQYFVAPGGDFEQQGSGGWSLDNGASIAVGGASIVAGPARTTPGHSLKLPAGSSATSPAFCVDERYPSFRFRLGQLGPAPAGGKVTVSVVYPGLTGENVRKATDLDARALWTLTPSIDLKPTYGTNLGGWRLVALRYDVARTDPGADVRVDHVLVDPRMRL